MPINKTTITNMSGAFDSALAAGRISEALNSLHAFARAVSADYDTLSDIASLRESYDMLCRFLICGTDDPDRQMIADDIAARACEIRNRIERQSLAASGEPTLYFSTLRFEDTRTHESIAGIAEAYLSAVRNNMSRATSESMAIRLFNRVWVTCPLSAHDTEALHSILAADTAGAPIHARILIIGALLLGSLRYFDTSRAILLADIYRINHSEEIGAVALAALLLALSAAPTAATGHRKLRSALMALTDISTFADDIRMAFMQLIRSRDTERVSRKLTDELIPDIMKLRPEITKTMGGSSLPQSPIDEDGGLNPEWENIIEKSGLGDKLRELNELQSEGADVLMTTMSGLKDFSFFNDPANWFLPFYAGHSVADSPDLSELSRAIQHMPMMCNGDKYSLVLFAARMGSSLGNGLRAQFEEQQRHLDEIKSSGLDSDKRRRADAANSFVQDTYRFFKLFRRKGEFNDPFLRPLNPLTTPLLRDVFTNDAASLELPAEFYFRRGHYREALELFERIEELIPPSAELYQKKGYAHEMTGNKEAALEAYHTADLIDSESVWTLRRIAALLRMTGRSQEAPAIYDRIQSIKPDRRADIMARALCMMELNRYSDALTLLYKADYLKPDRIATLRPLARCQLITGEAAKCRDTCMRIAALPDQQLNADDHMLAGHACLALRNYSGAIEAYAHAISAMNFDEVTFLDRIKADNKLVERICPDRLTSNIIIEAAIARAATQGSHLDK